MPFAMSYSVPNATTMSQVLLAAGRDIGPDNDALLKFKHLWIDPGLCTDAGQQLLL